MGTDYKTVIKEDWVSFNKNHTQYTLYGNNIQYFF